MAKSNTTIPTTSSSQSSKSKLFKRPQPYSRPLMVISSTRTGNSNRTTSGLIIMMVRLLIQRRFLEVVKARRGARSSQSATKPKTPKKKPNRIAFSFKVHLLKKQPKIFFSPWGLCLKNEPSAYFLPPLKFSTCVAQTPVRWQSNFHELKPFFQIPTVEPVLPAVVVFLNMLL